jgi:predicted aspartyl protease
LIESKIKDTKPKFSKPFQHPNHNHSTNLTKLPQPLSSKTPPSTNIPTNQSTQPVTATTSKLPIKRFSPTQMQEHRALGLCYNCDEKFVIGHKCATGRYLLLILEPDETYEEEEALPDTTHNSTETYFQLSTHALTGTFSPQTLRFQAQIHGLTVTVLIDTGSTHNMLQPRIASHLQLPTQQIPTFSVMVGNGTHIQCSGLCPSVPITLQHNLFHIPFYLIPIEGADVVLGMEWLRNLGEIRADFSIPSISFIYNNNTITLTGDTTSIPQHASFHQICHLLHTDSVAALHLLSCTDTNDRNKPNSDELSTTGKPQTEPLPPEIETLLHQFSSVFSKPHGLPPSRLHDHHIPIFPNTPPINVKPYRYPHSQKDAMTSLIQEMLHEGIIIPSNSPYSSPVLLV